MSGISSFGDRLKDAREQAGKTKEAVAEGVGRSADTVAAWERNEHTPHRNTLIRLAHLLDVSIAELEG